LLDDLHFVCFFLDRFFRRIKLLSSLLFKWRLDMLSADRLLVGRLICSRYFLVNSRLHNRPMLYRLFIRL
jgi:hypothetical protein